MSRLFFLVTVLFSFITVSVVAQSPYRLDWQREGALTVFGASTWGSSFLLEKQTNPFTTAQLAEFSNARINSFDRIATYNYSDEAQKTSDILSLGAKILPVVFLLDKKPRNDFGTVAALYAETFLISNSLTSLAKTSVHRARPFVYNDSVPIDQKQTIDAQRSFISGHTSKTAAMTFFSAKIFADYHPDSDWKPVIWASAAVIPAVTGYMRVKAGKHFPTDVIAGYVVGAATGILVPELHKKKVIKNENLNLSVGLTGASMNLAF